jgi:hypothetical protein
MKTKKQQINIYIVVKKTNEQKNKIKENKKK